MNLALIGYRMRAGLRVPEVVIRDPGCVSKTWPRYFDVFRHL